ncbi:MAG: complex I NDUFA9 subunit family protein [Ramlibacter sp.]|nr:complex I NDUFA9 subunit family protein [Ramlibacter sp.]
MARILVLGGTGFVGRHVCEKLARLQWRVTVPTRRRHHARDLLTLPLLDVVEADVHDEATLTRLVAGHEAVVHLVAILHGNKAAFDKVHVALPSQLARACAAARVDRVVHVSALGAGEQAASMYQRSKARGEAALAGVPALTVLRPSVIFGAEDRFLNLFAQLQRVLPVVPLAGADARFQPVWVEDVAQAIVQALRRPTSAGRVFEACGPDVLTLRELVRLAGQASGCMRPIIGLPPALARLQAALMELAPGEPLMSRDNLDAMKTDNIASGTLPGLDALGIAPSALAAVLPGYLGAGVAGSQLNRFRARSAGY